MKNSPTETRVLNEMLERMLTTKEKLALYGLSSLIKAERRDVVPIEPVEGAQWPARSESARWQPNLPAALLEPTA